MSTVYEELQKLINSISERKQKNSTNTRVPTVWSAGAVANRMPCPSYCQCPGGCPMDVTESDAQPTGLACDTDANRCPFDGPRCWWPCPPNCQCPGECPMDVTETDEQIGVDTRDVDRFQPDGQQYAWPGNARNGVYPEQFWTDFPPVYGQFGVDTRDVGRFQSTDRQYAWPDNAQNVVSPEQYWTDVMQREANANMNVYSSTESEVSLFGSCSCSSDEVF